MRKDIRPIIYLCAKQTFRPYTQCKKSFFWKFFIDFIFYQLWLFVDQEETFLRGHNSISFQFGNKKSNILETFGIKIWLFYFSLSYFNCKTLSDFVKATKT